MASHRLQLAERDGAILEILARHVRVITDEQAARAKWGSTIVDRAACRRRLAKLVAGDWLHVASVNVLAMPPLDRPLAAWRPWELAPDLGAVAYQLRVRWTGPTKRACVYWATRKTARLYGGVGNGRIKHPFQIQHDVGVAEMYLAVRRHRPAMLRHWIGEDRLAPYRLRQKLPDAVLARGPAESPHLILEFGGRYDKRRLAAFHDDALIRGTPYEIW